MKKRILSLLLALVLALSLLPVSALADEAGGFTVSNFELTYDEDPFAFTTFSYNKEKKVIDVVVGGEDDAETWTISLALTATGALTDKDGKKLTVGIFEDGSHITSGAFAKKYENKYTAALTGDEWIINSFGSLSTYTLVVGYVDATTANDYTKNRRDYTKYDAKQEFTLNVKRSASLYRLSVTGCQLSPSFNAGQPKDVYTVYAPKGTTEITLNLGVNMASQTNVFINNSENAETLSKGKCTVTVPVNGLKNGPLMIPIDLKYTGKDGNGVDSRYTLTVVSAAMPKITTQPASSVECGKSDSKTISVAANLPADGGALSYQWYWSSGDTMIDGATSNVFTIPTDHSYFGSVYCKVTNTVDGESYAVNSEKCIITVNPTTITAPVVSGPVGGGACKIGGQLTLTASESHVDVYGIEKPVCRWYKNTIDSTMGGVYIGESDFVVKGEENVSEFAVPTELVPGTYYYYCAVTLTASKNAGVTATTVSSATQSITYESYDGIMGDMFQGTGTKENPYQIHTAEELELVKYLVNEKGLSFSGMYFKFMNDITLPADWTPMGCTKDGTHDIKKGENLNAFSGILDGNGKTLTVPKGGLPLLGYVNGAEVRNLNIYGEEINGYGLVNNLEGVGLSGSAIVIDHVTLKSGTKTLKAGLIGSNINTNIYAGCSATFVVTIRNCTVEKGVVIGYDGTQSEIGSFAGRMLGTIENCVSYAEVKGVNYVGGIIATRDNALGVCDVRNCTFNGTVTAIGEYAGGIVGGGYNANASAPNGVRITIENCVATGTVSGVKNVGGILGGDEYVAQAWDSYSLTGNTFSGKVSGQENVGGIIGYYRSLNKFDNISNNIYAADCGATKGIAAVQYVDTNQFANLTEKDGTIYFNTSKMEINMRDTNTLYLYANDGTLMKGPTVRGCDWKANLNRTDDPLGKDAVKLCRSTNESLLPDDNGAGTPGNAPATGDTGVLVWVIALPVTILAATFVLKRKEREA